MRFGAGDIARAAKGIAIVGILGWFFAGVGFATEVYAENTNIQVSVDSGTLHPSLVLTVGNQPMLVEAMPVEITGIVKDLSQIQVYVDNVFAVTIPLDQGATTFSHNLIIPQGPHSVKFVGITPFANVNPTESIVITYTPVVSGTTQPSDSSSVSPQKGGAVISRSGMSTTAMAADYTQPSYATAMPSWLYSGLLALDIARSDDSNGSEVIKTLQRIVVVGISLLFIMFARPTLSFYRLIRYKWLGFNKRPLPSMVRKRPLLFIRSSGLLLFFSVLMFC